MTEYNEAEIWSAIKRESHPVLSKKERTILNYMPLIAALFPGIEYSMRGFGQIMKDYVPQALSKLFPDVHTKSAQEVSRNRKVSVESFLPSNGYEYRDNPDWEKQLEALLE